MASYQSFSGSSGGGGDIPDLMDLIAPQDQPQEEHPVQNNNAKKVVLEQRTQSVQGPQQAQQAQAQAQQAQVAEPKLSPAEIQRRRINAASEYYRKLRENNGNKDLGPPPGPPPLIPTTSAQLQQAQQPSRVTTSSASSSPSAGSMNSFPQLSLDSNPQVAAKPNIDLGAIVRSTIINGVTKTFTQVSKF